MLATACRKLISRSLSGKRGENDVKEDDNIFLSLQYKEEVWKKYIFNDVNFDNDFEVLLTIPIRNENAIDLYDVLGGDAELLGKAVQQKEEEKNKNVKKEKNKKKKKIVDEEEMI